MFEIPKRLKSELNSKLAELNIKPFVKDYDLEIITKKICNHSPYIFDENSEDYESLYPYRYILDLIKDINTFKENLDVQYYHLNTDVAESVVEYTTTLSQQIRKNIFKSSEVTKEVIEILTFSENSYIVGGFVRDAFKNPKDIDFVTDIPISNLKELFTKENFTVKNVGEHYLVLMVSKNGENFEISNFRKDKDNSKGEIGTIQEDAQRRDFTINALYCNLISKNVIDPNRTGLNDLQNEILKFIGNPQHRIEEDYNRVFRFYRFVSKGFKPNKNCLSDIRRNFEKALKETSSERIRNEIERIVL